MRPPGYECGEEQIDSTRKHRRERGIDWAPGPRLLRTCPRGRSLGPIFDAAVIDWEHHIANITDFWSSIVLQTGRYAGSPMRAHLVLPLRDEHFDRWLMIFEKTAREQFTAEAADIIVDRARRIADSFEMGIASRRGEIVSPRHTFSAAPTSG
jgi:hemoglobin